MLLDVPALVRGGSRGFTVLVVGELIALAVGAFVGVLGGLLFAMTAAAGPIAAGTVAVRPGPPAGVADTHKRRWYMAQGAFAGLLGYALTVPLRLMGGGRGAAELAFSIVASTALGAFGGRAVMQAGGEPGKSGKKGEYPSK